MFLCFTNASYLALRKVLFTDSHNKASVLNLVYIKFDNQVCLHYSRSKQDRMLGMHLKIKARISGKLFCYLGSIVLHGNCIYGSIWKGLVKKPFLKCEDNYIQMNSPHWKCICLRNFHYLSSFGCLFIWRMHEYPCWDLWEKVEKILEKL